MELLVLEDAENIFHDVHHPPVHFLHPLNPIQGLGWLEPIPTATRKKTR